MMATTVGETGADFLNMNLGIWLTNTSLIMAGLWVIALIIQLQAKKYIPIRYRTVVLFISVVGTLITDNMVDNLGISLQMSSIVFAIALVITFVIRYIREKTLSVHTIDTTRRELFYRVVILFTFALWTAVGDLLAEWLHLGYALSTLMFLGGIAVIAVAHRYLKLNSVWAFWIAYVLTRPLWASFGDYLSQGHINWWLGLWTVSTSIIFIVIISSLVFILTQKENKKIKNLTV